MNADEIPLFVDGAEKFLDMFQSAGMGIFSDVPSRMLPYMEHRGFHPEEIEAIKRMSESDAVSLSAIISSDDPEESSEAAGRLMSKAGPDGAVWMKVLKDLRAAADNFSGRKGTDLELCATSTSKAVPGPNGTMESGGMYFIPLSESKAELRSCIAQLEMAAVSDRIVCSGRTYAVVSIGESAFEMQKSLSSVSLPRSIKKIGAKAFAGCSSLETVEIPRKTEEIGESAFDGCSSMTSFTVSPNNASFAADRQGILYSKDFRLLIRAPCGMKGNALIPGETAEIGSGAFSGCKGLASVDMDDSVVSIGSWAFFGCESMVSIELSQEITEIGVGAFYGCASLTSASIPDGVRSLESRTFSGCASLSGVTLPYSLKRIEKWAFEGCHSLSEVRIPPQVQTIDSEAFAMCPSIAGFDVDYRNKFFSSDSKGILYENRSKALRKVPRAVSGAVAIKEGVEYISDKAFEGCEGLSSVEFPKSLKAIGKKAFKGCTSLRSVSIPEQVEEITDDTFLGCSSLEEVVLPPSISKIRCGAFAGCHSLGRIIIPGNAVSIGYGAFDEGVTIVRGGYPSSRERMPMAEKLSLAFGLVYK
ncbi:MAG: leucine-rich repeat domain-containing protein [Candidatus Methanomethylophilaceae archaeon]|nr:leucine-rich repeat domain-containing protein [Candidatus Methanomethylophilaceae archaeon]